MPTLSWRAILFAGGALTMHRFLRLSVLLLGLLAAASYAADAPQPALTTDDDLGFMVSDLLL